MDIVTAVLVKTIQSMQQCESVWNWGNIIGMNGRIRLAHRRISNQLRLTSDIPYFLTIFFCIFYFDEVIIFILKFSSVAATCAES